MAVLPEIPKIITPITLEGNVIDNFWYKFFNNVVGKITELDSGLGGSISFDGGSPSDWSGSEFSVFDGETPSSW